MHYYILSLVTFLLSVMFIVLTFREVKVLEFTDSNSEKDCNIKHLTNVKEGDECGAWDGTQCRRGIVKNGQCVSKGTIIPLSLFILFLISLISSIVLLVLGIKHRHDMY